MPDPPRRRRPSPRSLLVTVILAVAVAWIPAAGALAGAGKVVRHERRHRPAQATRLMAHATGKIDPGVVHTMTSAGPTARAASINPVVKPFQFFLFFSEPNTHQLLLKYFTLAPIFPHQAAPLGGCLHCQGNGRFQPFTVSHNKLTETIRGTRILTTSTDFTQAIVRRGAIGRFKVLGVKFLPAAPFAATPIVQQGCLAADATVTSPQLINRLPLPLIACNAPNPTDGSSSFYHPPELSKTSSLTGVVSGDAHGRRWVSVIKVHGSCGADAEQTIHMRGATGVAFHVDGTFRKLVPTGKDNRAGNFCVYLQSGGEWHGVPDGRVSQRGSFPYLAGDSVAITGATTAVVTPPATTVTPTNTFAGFASVKETLWTFDAATPCASTATSELDAATGVGDFPVKGLFSLNIMSFPLSSTFYRCAYLNDGPATGGKPTGLTVASASALITVS